MVVHLTQGDDGFMSVSVVFYSYFAPAVERYLEVLSWNLFPYIHNNIILLTCFIRCQHGSLFS